MSMGVNQLFKRYLVWFSLMVLLTYAFSFVNGVLFLLSGIACIVVPSDRVRIYMLKNQHELPEPKKAWLLIFCFSIIPFFIGVFSSFFSDIPDGKYRANVVVSFMFFYGLFTFGLNSLLFLNKRMWEKASNHLQGKRN